MLLLRALRAWWLSGTSAVALPMSREPPFAAANLATATLALYSRLFAVALAIISDFIIPDHTPEGALISQFPAECAAAPFFRAFSRWDAAHFLTAAENGYKTEYSHAFFPLYPLLIRAISRLLTPLFGALLCAAEIRIFAGVLVSNALFIVAACCLHALGDRVLRDRALARAAACLFCVAPASVFFSSAYSDATYAACAFGGMLLLEDGNHWAASFTLATATACRANGLLNMLPLVYHRARRIANAGGLRASSIALLASLLQLSLVIGPYVAWQVIGYQRVCGQDATIPTRSHRFLSPTRIAHSSETTLPPGWCDQMLPDLYAHVQKTYWGVGLFSYYQLKQLPNFLLATPAIMLCAGGCYSTIVTLRGRYASVPWRELVRKGKPSSGDGARTPRALPYVAHWAILSLICLLVSNVQVTTRLVGAACPALYWYMAELLLLRKKTNGWLSSRRLRMLLLVYLGLFTIVGTALHSNGFPWT